MRLGGPALRDGVCYRSPWALGWCVQEVAFPPGSWVPKLCLASSVHYHHPGSCLAGQEPTLTILGNYRDQGQWSQRGPPRHGGQASIRRGSEGGSLGVGEKGWWEASLMGGPAAVQGQGTWRWPAQPGSPVCLLLKLSGEANQGPGQGRLAPALLSPEVGWPVGGRGSWLLLISLPISVEKVPGPPWWRTGAEGGHGLTRFTLSRAAAPRGASVNVHHGPDIPAGPNISEPQSLVYPVGAEIAPVP